MTDPLGMESDAPIITPPDVLELAWERYDEASTAAENARTDYANMTHGRIITLDNMADNATLRTCIAASAHADKEALMGECTCPDDGLTTCDKCSAYARVIAWDNERK